MLSYSYLRLFSQPAFRELCLLMIYDGTKKRCFAGISRNRRLFSTAATFFCETTVKKCRRQMPTKYAEVLPVAERLERWQWIRSGLREILSVFLKFLTSVDLDLWPFKLKTDTSGYLSPGKCLHQFCFFCLRLFALEYETPYKTDGHSRNETSNLSKARVTRDNISAATWGIGVQRAIK